MAGKELQIVPASLFGMPKSFLGKYQRQIRLTVNYKEITAGEFRADFLVAGKIVVELKAIKGLTEIDEAQLLNYLSGRYQSIRL